MIRTFNRKSNKIFIAVILSTVTLTSCQVYKPKYATDTSKENISTVIKKDLSTTTSLSNTESNASNTQNVSSNSSSSSNSNSNTLSTNVETGTLSNINAAENVAIVEAAIMKDNTSSLSNTLNTSNTANTSNTSNTSNSVNPMSLDTNSVSINNLSNEEMNELIKSTLKEEILNNEIRNKKEAEKWKDKILPGITIGGIDVSGLTKEEAKEKVNTEILESLYEKELKYSVDGVKQTLTYGEMEVELKEDIYTNALSYGKDLGQNELLSLVKKGVQVDIKPEFTYNKTYINELADKYAARVRNDSLSKSVEYNDGEVTIKSDAKEKVLNKEEFLKFVKDNINTTIESTEEKAISIKTQKPSLKESDLKTITTEITSYSTDYSWSPDNRRHNVELAAKNLDNTLVMPGAEFSFNRMVGPQTKEYGFADSLVYVGNKTVYEPGGGVCQVSTTLYNSLLNIGIDPTERTNHGMTIAYAPLGMDATVAEPYLDFKFRNTLKHPILIKTYYDGVNLTFSIYGEENDLNGYTYKYETEVLNKTPYKTEIVEDPELPLGYEKTETTPYDGFEVKVYKITYKDGKEIKKDLYGNDKYTVVNEIIRRGTGDPNVKTVPVETTPDTSVPPGADD